MLWDPFSSPGDKEISLLLTLVDPKQDSPYATEKFYYQVGVAKCWGIMLFLTFLRPTGLRIQLIFTTLSVENVVGVIDIFSTRLCVIGLRSSIAVAVTDTPYHPPIDWHCTLVQVFCVRTDNHPQASPNLKPIWKFIKISVYCLMLFIYNQVLNMLDNLSIYIVYPNFYFVRWT